MNQIVNISNFQGHAISEDYSDGYYHIGKDIADYPNAWCYIVYSRRGPGKTYSMLLWSLINKKPIIYMKRTIDDVNLICSANEYGFDPSPYVPLNRDLGTNIKAIKIRDGIGAFYNINDEGNPAGLPVSYILAMSAVKKFKGFDFSAVDVICFDEFIPQIGERTAAGNKEGELLMDLYMTTARDRLKRGREPLKLILFANAEEISTPVTNTLEVVDIMSDLNASGRSHYYDEDRDILIHHITQDEYPIQEQEKSGIYKAMINTAWGQKSFEGEFSNNDFTNVMKINLKKFKCMIKLHYKTHDYYIYLNPNTGLYYMTTSQQKALFEYDLNKENDQKKFWLEHGIDLRLSCIEDKFKFQKYTMYDLIINYKKFFNI